VAEAKREEAKIYSFDDGPTGPKDDRESGASVASGSDAAAFDSPDSGESPLAAELAKLRAEKDDLTQTLVRRQADFENFRKRTERDRLEESRRGVERMMMDIIPVLDGFDRALQGHDDPAYEEYRKGIILIRKQLWDVLTRYGVQRVDAAGKIFDPHVHQAIERVESSELPDGSIVDVFQDGYTFHGRVLRPAIVRVAVHPVDGANSAHEYNETN
jgi:molecular chaperone GrpE